MPDFEIDNGNDSVPEDYIKKSVLFIINTHAATVNMRLYPPSSSMVLETLEQAHQAVVELLMETETFSTSVFENKILVNGVKLDDFDQQRPPIKSYVNWMNERGLATLDFEYGVTLDELRATLEVIGLMAVDPDIRQNLQEELAERGVSHIALNQRVYVAVAPGMDASAIAAGIGGKVTPLDALKDELLIRYLMGQIELQNIEEKDLVNVLSDSTKVGGLLSSFIAHEGAEGVFVRSQKAEEGLNRLAAMAHEVTDEDLRVSLADQVTSIIAQMTPLEMTSVLSSKAPANIDIERVRQNVVEMLTDEQLMQIVDSLIVEYVEMKQQAGALPDDWTRERLRSMNEVLLDVRHGNRGDVLTENIDTKLDAAGIQEERDLQTGKRVLSAYQLLGGPLEEEDVLGLGAETDQAVTSQIRQLYEMGEHDLTAGMLVKLADNLGAESEKVRRYAAHLIKETLSELDDKQGPMAAEVLAPLLVESVVSEDDYQTFVHETDSLGLLTEVYLKNEEVDHAANILDLLISLTSARNPKGLELKRHAKIVLDSLMGPGGLIDPARILTQENKQKRLLTVKVLSKLGTDALQPLVETVKDRSQVDLRGRAIESLAAAGTAGIKALSAELKKPNPWYIYRNVLRTLSDIGDPAANEDISLMADNADERIRREVIWSLSRLGSRESLDFIKEAVNDPSPSVRRTAVRVLGSFGDTAVVAFLVDIINTNTKRSKDADRSLAEAACLALGDLHDSKYVPMLEEMLDRRGMFKKGKPDEIRAAAALALGTLGDASAVPALERAVRDQSLLVRTSAEKALLQLKGAVHAPQHVPRHAAHT
jgi:HEAT repeat protein